MNHQHRRNGASARAGAQVAARVGVPSRRDCSRRVDSAVVRLDLAASGPRHQRRAAARPHPPPGREPRRAGEESRAVVPHEVLVETASSLVWIEIAGLLRVQGCPPGVGLRD